MDKKTLRNNMKNKRNELNSNEISLFSDNIFNKIYQMESYKNANNIFCFVSFSSEVFTHNFIKKSISDGKNILIPYIDEKNNVMKATKLENFKDLEVGYYGILNLPEDKLKFIDPKLIDLVIVPGLIFDYNLYRIGYGGGFYDKFLSLEGVEPYKIGVCFDFQIVNDTYPLEHDVPLDEVVTEKRVLRKGLR